VDTIIRRADLRDVPSITSLFLEIAPQVIDREPVFRHIPDRVRVERRYESRVRDPERAVVVAVVDGSVVGFVDAALARNTDTGKYLSPGVDVFVEELTVTSASQRRGIGTCLMRAIEAWAKKTGARLVTLDTHVSNEGARRLYSALGYREIGVVFTKDL
jgi:ribosomal protein S18 acetylase RimI-like enzyme